MHLNPSLIMLCEVLEFGQSMAHATVIARSSIDIFYRQVNPASSKLVFLEPLRSTSFAKAQNSLVELDSQFYPNARGLGLANATLTFANANGSANGISQTVNAGSNVFIPDSIEEAAASIGRGTLLSSFMIRLFAPQSRPVHASHVCPRLQPIAQNPRRQTPGKRQEIQKARHRRDAQTSTSDLWYSEVGPALQSRDTRLCRHCGSCPKNQKQNHPETPNYSCACSAASCLLPPFS